MCSRREDNMAENKSPIVALNGQLFKKNVNKKTKNNNKYNYNLK